MNVSLVMTVIGEDRPGLVESVADLVADHGGNWLESRMSRLGGQFAGILRAQVPAEKEAPLVRALQSLGARGLAVVVQSDCRAPAQPEQKLMALELIGHDRPGIVRQVSRALAQRGVNVEELSTECLSAPMSGDILFKAHARLHVPENCDKAGLRRDLERIAADLIVDLTIEDLPSK